MARLNIKRTHGIYGEIKLSPTCHALTKASTKLRRDYIILSKGHAKTSGVYRIKG